MSYAPTFSYPPQTPSCSGSCCNSSRNPITPAEYSAMIEPPFPAGASIGANTPTGPSLAELNNVASFTEDMAVDQFIARTSGRGGGGYLDNILRMNRGKMARVRMTFNSGGNSSETKVFTGLIETAARDHIVLSDPQTGGRFLLLTIYLDYIEFPEEINYYYPGTNVLNITDEKVLQDHPELVPLFEYQKAKNNKFIAHLEALTLKNER